MEKFINEQISSFKNKKYNSKHFYKYKDELLVVYIKNNKITTEKYDNDIYGRIKKVIAILNLLVSKYKLSDTVLLIYTKDGYYWKKDIPVFNISIPLGKQGLIFINYDILRFYINSTTIKNYDQIKKKCKETIPKKIINDIYFKGGLTSIKRSQIREKLAKENLPININLSKNYEDIYYLKNHKYLLDLPGTKPWSVRLKFLFLMSKVIFRISFYNSKINETSYWRQYFDYIFIENEDYVHFKYDVDYDNKINNNLFIKIKNDIINKYNEFEKEKKLYETMIKNLEKKKKKININSSLKYLFVLIESYTKNIIDLNKT